MPVIKYAKIMERIFKKPVFGPKDMHNEGMPRNYSKNLLYMLAKSGRISRIERGKYTILDDPIAIAAHMTEPCYLSFWTAMSIRNITNQIPFAVEVVTSRKRFNRNISFMNTKIIFHTVKPRMMFGYENIVWKENIRIPVANTEKIIIDAILVGNIPKDEISHMVGVSDITRLKKYAELSGDDKISDKIKELTGKCSRRMK